MAIAANTKKMEELLEGIAHDLKKAMRGNKAAAQRVRTKTIKLEKTAKLWRKESMKTGFSKKKVVAKAKKRTAPKAKKTTAKRTVRKAAKRVVRKAAKKPVRRATRRARK